MNIEGLASVQARIDAITAALPAIAPGTSTPPPTDATAPTSFADSLTRAIGTRGTSSASSRTRGDTHAFLDAALRQAGDRYVWGAETSPDQVDPSAFDCSELVQWAAAQAGVSVPDGSWNQFLQLARDGHEMSVDEALRTPGALLFSFSEDPKQSGGRPRQAHVAISLGDGRTIEARGVRHGVGVFDSTNRHFTNAASIPGL